MLHCRRARLHPLEFSRQLIALICKLLGWEFRVRKVNSSTIRACQLLVAILTPMPQPSSSQTVRFVMSGLLVIGTIACSNFSQSSRQTVAPTVPSPVVASPIEPTPEPLPASPEPVVELDPYELASDRAASATSIGMSAQSQDDWKLVVSEWQAAIDLLKRVPNASPYRALAKTKLADYQRQLKRAQQLAAKPDSSNQSRTDAIALAPPPATTAPVSAPRSNVATQPTQTTPSSDKVFQAPIKRREGGTPVIDVRFNGQQTFEMIVDTGASGTLITQAMASALGVQPVTKALVDTASQKGVEIPVGFVDSMEVDGATARNVAVAIANSDLDIGLLGHDFFGNFDVTIKRDVVEFRVR